MRLLIIQSNAERLEALATQAGRCGAEITGRAGSANEALSACLESEPDVVLVCAEHARLVNRMVGTPNVATVLVADTADGLSELIRDVRPMGCLLYPVSDEQLRVSLCAASARLSLESEMEKSAVRLCSILEADTNLICRFRPDGALTFANEAYRKAFQFAGHDVQTHGHFRYVPQVEHEEALRSYAMLSPHNDTVVSRRRTVLPEGELRWFEWLERGFFDENGQLAELQAQGRDITGHMHEITMRDAAIRGLEDSIENISAVSRNVSAAGALATALQASETLDIAYEELSSRAPYLLGPAPGALLRLDDSGGFLELATSWGALALDATCFVADQCSEFGEQPCCNRDDAGRLDLCPLLAANGASGNGLSCKCVPLQAAGKRFGVLVQQYRSEDDVRWYDAVDEVAERIAPPIANLINHAALRESAAHDALTGLHNRRFFKEAFANELQRAQRVGEPLGVLMIDVDRFKAFNDKLGHLAGDQVLAQTAAYLECHTRPEDVLCRFGGEEFVVLMPATDQAEAMHRAEVLREGVRLAVMTYDGKPLPRITVSAGVAGFPDHGTTPTDLLKSADQALYRAKCQGRNRVCAA